MIKLSGFTKRFREHQVLHLPTYSFAAGLHWIQGPNGSGKSTLLKCLAGILPFEGTVQFNDGICLPTDPVNFRRRLTYSEPEPLYPPYLTLREILRYYAVFRKVSAEEVIEKATALELAPHLSKPAGACSSGTLKKVSLAQSFCGAPDLLLLDEPFITLDEPSRKTIVQWLEQQLQRGAVVLVSSHEGLEGYGLPTFTGHHIVNGTLQ